LEEIKVLKSILKKEVKNKLVFGSSLKKQSFLEEDTKNSSEGF